MSNPVSDGLDVEVEAGAWDDALPDSEDIARGAALAALGGDARRAVSVLLTDDEAVRDLNVQFRAVDAPTNVLAFPAAPRPGGVPAADAALGDIALAFGVCAREAQAQGKPLADHLRHLVIHGVLHLLGHDHQDDAEASAMEARERELLAGLGVPDPYARDEDAGAAPLDPPGAAERAVLHG